MQTQNKHFLTTINPGDILIQQYLRDITSRVKVIEIVGDIIVVEPYNLNNDTLELLAILGVDNTHLYYSINTGGIVDPLMGFDGNRPNESHPNFELYSEISCFDS